MKTKYRILTLVLSLVLIAGIGYIAIKSGKPLSSGNSAVSDDFSSYLPESDNLELPSSVPSKPYSDLLSKVTDYTPVDGKVAYLTFDDGPSSVTRKILNILAENNIKATFFVTQGTNSAIYKEILAGGHEIGIHSYSHSLKKIYASKEAFFEDFDKLRSRVIEKTNGYVPKVFRFPGGSTQPGKAVFNEIVTELNRRGYDYYDWHVDSYDSRAVTVEKSKIVNNVLNQSKKFKTPIILMHDTSPKTTTAEALQEIIDGLREQGFSFEKLTQNTKPYQMRKYTPPVLSELPSA